MKKLKLRYKILIFFILIFVLVALVIYYAFQSGYVARWTKNFLQTKLHREIGFSDVSGNLIQSFYIKDLKIAIEDSLASGTLFSADEIRIKYDLWRILIGSKRKIRTIEFVNPFLNLEIEKIVKKREIGTVDTSAIAQTFKIANRRIIKLPKNIPSFEISKVVLKNGSFYLKVNKYVPFENVEKINLEGKGIITWDVQSIDIKKLDGYFVEPKVFVNNVKGKVSMDTTGAINLIGISLLTSMGASFSGSGKVYKDSMDIQVSGKNISMKETIPIINHYAPMITDKDLVGICFANAHIYGSYKNVIVTGTGTSKKGLAYGFHFTDLNSGIFINKNKVEIKNASAKTGNGLVRGKINFDFNSKVPKYQAEFSLSSIDIFEVLAQTPYNINVPEILHTTIDGTAKATGMGFTDKDVCSKFSVQLNVSDIAQTPFTRMASNFRLIKDSLSIENLDIWAGEAMIEANGYIHNEKINIAINTREITSKELKEFFPSQDIQGKWNVKGNIGGTLKNPNFDGTFSILDGKYKNFISFESVEGKGNLMTFSPFPLGMFNMSIYKGKILNTNLDSLKLNVTLDTDKDTTGNMFSKLVINPLFVVVDSENWFETLTEVQMKKEQTILNIKDFSLTGRRQKLSNYGDIQITLDKNGISLDRVEFVHSKEQKLPETSYEYSSSKRSIISASGKYVYGKGTTSKNENAEDEVSLYIFMEAIDIGLLTALLDIPISSQISGELDMGLSLQGTTSSPQLDASFDITEPTYQGIPISNLAGDIYYNNQSLNFKLDKIEWSSKSNIAKGHSDSLKSPIFYDFSIDGQIPLSLSLKGSMPKILNKDISLNMMVYGADLTPLLNSMNLPYKINVFLPLLRVSLKGTSENPIINSSIDVEDLSYSLLNIGDFLINFFYKDEKVNLTVKRIRGDIYSPKISDIDSFDVRAVIPIKLSLLEKPELPLTLPIDIIALISKFDIGNLLSIVDPEQKIRADAIIQELDISLAGTHNQPQIKTTVLLNNLSFQNILLGNAKININYDNGEISGKSFFDNSTRGMLAGLKTDFSLPIQLTNSKEFLTAILKGYNISIYNKIPKENSINVLTLKDDGEMNFYLSSEDDIDIMQLINALLPNQSLPVKAILDNIKITAKGSLKEPEISANTRLNNLFYNDVPLGNANIDISYEHNIITINYVNLEKDKKVYFNSNGTLPFSISFTPIECKALEDSPINITANLDNMNPVIANYFFPQIDIKSGDVSGQLLISGQMGNPYIDGELFANNGVIDVPLINLTIKDLKGKAIFKEHSIILEPFSSNIEGGGSATVSEGKIQMNELLPEDISVSFQGNKVRLNPLSDIFVTADGKFSFIGNFKERLKLKGDIFISEGLITIPFESGGQATPPPQETESNIDFDVSIKAESNIWLRNSQTNMELKGDIQARSDKSLIFLSGELSVIRGIYNFLNYEFIVAPNDETKEPSKLKFMNTPEINPFLDITAKYFVNTTITEVDEKGDKIEIPTEVEITLYITGPADNMTPKLTAKDKRGRVYTNNDIVTLLMWGVTMEQIDKLSRTEAGAELRDKLKEYAENSLSREIVARTWFDTFKLSTPLFNETRKDTIEVTIGKRITENLYVSLSHTQNIYQSQDLFSSTGKKVRVEYLLMNTPTTSASLIGETSGQSGYIFDAKIIRRY